MQRIENMKLSLSRSSQDSRRWSLFKPQSGEGFIGLSELAGFFGTESRHQMLDANYLSAWSPKRAGERRAYLERIVKATPCWLGTPAPPRSPW